MYINDTQVKKITSSSNQIVPLRLKLMYEDQVLDVTLTRFMFTLDQDIASYKNSTGELFIHSPGKTKLLLVDGLNRKEFDIIVK